MHIKGTNCDNEDEQTRVKVSLRSREVRVGLTRVWRCRVSVTWSRGAALTRNQVQWRGV